MKNYYLYKTAYGHEEKFKVISYKSKNVNPQEPCKTEVYLASRENFEFKTYNFAFGSMMPSQQISQNQVQSLIAEECLANIKVDRTFAPVGGTKSKI